MGLRTVHELRGIACHDLETGPASKQTTCCSRTFGEAVTDKTHVRDAVVAFATRAAEKIRVAGQVCGAIQLFIATDRFDTTAPQHAPSATSAFMTPTADSRSIVAAALRTFERLWRDGFAYRKAGVLLLDLCSAGDVMPSLFTDERPQSRPLMMAMDKVNERFGRGSIGLGLSTRTAPWRMRQGNLSPRFTTRWQELPVARIMPEAKNDVVR